MSKNSKNDVNKCLQTIVYKNYKGLEARIPDPFFIYLIKAHAHARVI